MRDPMTEAFNLGNLITIWHVDPELDGTDDSCGWFRPKLTKEQRLQVQYLAEDEARDPFIQAARCKKIESPGQSVMLLLAALHQVEDRLNTGATSDDISRAAYRLGTCGYDHIRNHLCFLPGYHSNRSEDRLDDRIEAATELYLILARYLLGRARPWYRHPRWHIHHWRVQVHPIQKLKRWLFSRCAKCENRFAFGESPISGQWGSAGPQWFKSEESVYHHGCYPSIPRALHAPTPPIDEDEM